MAAGLALACAVLFREPIGLIGCVMTLLALALGLLRRIRALRAHDIVVAGGAVAAILLALNASGLLTAYRIHYQGVPAGKSIVSHGIAHNLYIGLGSEPNEPNPFGIQWSDTAGANAVKAVDPTIPYGSEKYFDTLMSLYFKAVRDHPFGVARIYASRMSRVLGPLILPIIFITLAAIFAGLALPRAQGPPSPYHHVLIDFSLVVAIGTLLQAAQAVLTVPTLAYYFQADLGLYVLGALAFDVWFRVIWSDPFRRGGDRRADDLPRPQTANNPERPCLAQRAGGLRPRYRTGGWRLGARAGLCAAILQARARICRNGRRVRRE